MPIKVGAVIAIQGSAEVTLANGQTKALSLNDIVNMGDIISTPDNSQVVIHTGTSPLTVKPGETLRIEPSSASAQISAAKADAQNQATPFDPNTLEPSGAGQTSEEPEQNDGVIDTGVSISQLSTLQPLSLDDSFLSSNDNSSSINNPSVPAALDDDESSNTSQQALDGKAPSGDAENYDIILGQVNLSEDTNIEHNGAGLINAAPQTLETQYGSLTVADNGSWQYQLNNQLSDIQQLAAGEALEEVITINGGDNARYQLAITINGSNDSAQIDGDRKATLTEDQQLSSQGFLEVDDLDFGEARLEAKTEIKTSFGSAQVNGNGVWEYVLDNQSTAIQGLSEGERLIDSFAATSLDGTTEIIRITINGTNDTPVFSGSNQSKLYIEDSPEAQGKLSIDDADHGESVFIASDALSGRYGTGSIDTEGNWSYRADTDLAAVDNLTAGQHIYDQFTVSSADGTTQHIIVAIKGGNEPIGMTAEASADHALAQLDFSEELLSSPDLYIWQPSTSSSDNGLEIINGFTAGADGDTLVLTDLVIEQGDDLDLEQYLQFDVGPEGTTLHISQDSTNDTQDILLSGFDASLHGSSNSEIISSLINAGNLEISSIA